MTEEATLEAYVSLLNKHGLNSMEEQEFLSAQAGDKSALRLLRTARALKVLYESFSIHS